MPTTIINGLTVLLERRISPQLHRLIWGVAVDREGVAGTGWVSSKTLSDLLSNWFALAWKDGYEDGGGPLPYTSEIVAGGEERKVAMGRNNPLSRCLNGGGVACLSTGKKGDHYSLVLGVENGTYLGFDCWWDEKKTPRRLVELNQYYGLVNVTWSRDELESEVERK